MTNSAIETTLIRLDKVRAYLATSYRICQQGQEIVLTIGQRSEALREVFARHGAARGALITAYNPLGAMQHDRLNDAAHAQLAARLKELGVEVIEGWSGDEGSNWPAEPSYFALGLDLERAKAVGKLFVQDAIVWVEADAVPRLILLR